jgi:hypothetical protein
MVIERTVTCSYVAKCDWCSKVSVTRGTRADAMLAAFENDWEFTQGQSRTQVVLCDQCAEPLPIRKRKGTS